ncbi:MAG: hypothetical protein EBX50_01595 [Chitinophagia bacterium]|nr:hypothetical protein [Chitinophagia bacterium]
MLVKITVLFAQHIIFQGKKLLLSAACLLAGIGLYAQDFGMKSEITGGIGDSTILSTPLQISEIIVTGNAKTRPFIILRELPFRKGDTIAVSNLPNQLKLAKEQLMNTSLFVDVEVYVSTRIQTAEKQQATITVAVKERWFLFPVPYFKLIDRNFNQWWIDQQRSLDRVNYGLKFIQNNFTGRNDNLDIWLITGYNNQISFRYQLPFINKKLTSGLNVGFAYATQKELNFITLNNKQQFFRQDSIVRETVRFDVTYSYRPDVRQRHYFRLTYNKEHVADTILQLNPQYFPIQGSRFRWLDFNYQYKYYNVDYIPYPTRGWMMEANLYTRLFQSEANLWQASARVAYVLPITPDIRFLHFEGIGVVKSPVNRAFVNQRLLGYGYTQMRGLEYNVVDGSAAALLKTTFHQRLISVILQNPVQSKSHDRIPFRVFLKAFADFGYSYNRFANNTNTLNNTMLRSWGIGLDIVSIYDFVFKIEFSMNQLGTDGVYLHSRNDF